MSLLFISARPGVVGEDRRPRGGDAPRPVREQGPVAQIFAQPQDAYTRALLACRPSLTESPARLTVIDDFIAGRSSSATPARPKDANAPVVLDVRGLRRASGSSAASSAGRSSRPCGVDFSSAATRWAWWANRARARRRWASRCCACTSRAAARPAGSPLWRRTCSASTDRPCRPCAAASRSSSRTPMPR